MNLKETFQQIQSDEFAAYLGAASDLKTFLRAAQQQEQVSELSKALNSSEHLQAVLSQVHDLSRKKVDSKYENPWDTALAIYIWLIYSKDSELAQQAAQDVAQAPQCWWAAKIAHYILLSEAERGELILERYAFPARLPITAPPVESVVGQETVL